MSEPSHATTPAMTGLGGRSKGGEPEAETRARRATDLVELLQEVAVIANGSDSVAEAVGATLRRVCEHTACGIARAYRRTEDARLVPDSLLDLRHGGGGEAGSPAGIDAAALECPGPVLEEVVESRRTRWLGLGSVTSEAAARTWSELDLRTAVVSPVLAGRRVVGCLCFWSRAKSPPAPALLDALDSIGAQLGRVAERRELEKRIADLTDSEHRRMGQDLHDGLGQQITGIGMLASSLEKRLRASGSPEADRAARLVEALREAQHQVRALSRGLMPVQLDANGLMSALSRLVEETCTLHETDCVFHCRETVQVEDGFTATHLYRIAQEAIHNAVKHSGAERIEIELESAGERLKLEVRDDGSGLPPDLEAGDGMGLEIMRYRARLVGGELEIATLPGGGTVVACTLEAAGQGRAGQGGEG